MFATALFIIVKTGNNTDVFQLVNWLCYIIEYYAAMKGNKLSIHTKTLRMLRHKVWILLYVNFLKIINLMWAEKWNADCDKENFVIINHTTMLTVVEKERTVLSNFENLSNIIFQ